MGILANTLTNTVSYRAYLEPIVQLVQPAYRSLLCKAKVTDVRRAGSFIEINLYCKPSERRTLNFSAGQFMQMHIQHEGRDLSRCFSPATSPQEFADSGKLTFVIRIQEGGQVTGWLAEHLRAGSSLRLSSPAGRFTLKDEPRRIFIAAGSGIAPILAMLSSLSTSALQQSVLLYSVRQRETAPVQAEIAALCKRGLRVHWHDTETQARIGQAELSELPHTVLSGLYVCGPQGLIDTCVRFWQEADYPAAQLHFESFGAPLNASMPASELAPNSIGDTPKIGHALLDQPRHLAAGSYDLPDSANVHFASAAKTVTWHQRTPHVLLELAEQAGLKPLSGCRIGVCHQCSCQKTSGRVLNLKTGQISDRGPQAIQLCQSLPVEDVTIAL